MTEHQLVGVSGCRLSDGKLHLGHFLGCLHPAKLKHISKLFFIIQDGSTNTFAGKERDHLALRLLLSQLYGMPNSKKIIPCLQSEIFATYAPLYDFARASLTLRNLRFAYRADTSRDSSLDLSIRDYLFPVDEAVQFLSVAATYVLMNDDNHRPVHIANRLRRRMAAPLKSRVPKVTLILTPAPRLFGSNGQKMAKRNHNCIYLMDNDAEVEEKLLLYIRNVGWRFMDGDHWEYRPALENSFQSDLPIKSLILSFAPHFAEADMIADAPRAIEEVFKTVLPLVGRVKSNARALLDDSTSLVARFERDQRRAIAHISNTIQSYSL